MRPDAIWESHRRSWAIDEMLAAHPELTRAEVEALYARVARRIGPAAAALRSEAPRRPRIRPRHGARGGALSDRPSRFGIILAGMGIALGLLAVLRLIGNGR